MILIGIFSIVYITVEHLIQWFSSPNIIELQPTAISLDIQNPLIEMKFKQVEIIERMNFFVNFEFH